MLFCNASLQDNEIIMDGQVNVLSCDMGFQAVLIMEIVDLKRRELEWLVASIKCCPLSIIHRRTACIGGNRCVFC